MVGLLPPRVAEAADADESFAPPGPQAGTTHIVRRALPAAWPTGSVKGLRAQGGFEVDLRWKRKRLDSATLRSEVGGKTVVRYGDRQLVVELAAGKSKALSVRDFASTATRR